MPEEKKSKVLLSASSAMHALRTDVVADNRTQDSRSAAGTQGQEAGLQDVPALCATATTFTAVLCSALCGCPLADTQNC